MWTAYIEFQLQSITHSQKMQTNRVENLSYFSVHHFQILNTKAGGGTFLRNSRRPGLSIGLQNQQPEIEKDLEKNSVLYFCS